MSPWVYENCPNCNKEKELLVVTKDEHTTVKYCESCGYRDFKSIKIEGGH